MIQEKSLLEALEINPEKDRVIAVVGGGGKTSLIFRLAEELTSSGKKVIITTTTHMAYDPGHPFAEDGDCRKIQQDLGKYNYTVAACLDRSTGKTGCLPEKVLCGLKDMADILLIEADGARRLPLKIPGEWEPVIPEFTDLVIGVAGMDAVGQPICRICHRPEVTARFLSKSVDENVSAEDVVRIVSSEQGMQKHVSGRRYRVFLNKAELPGKQDTAHKISENLKKKQILNAWGSLQGREYYR